MGHYCFARWRLPTVVVVCNAAGVWAGRPPGARAGPKKPGFVSRQTSCYVHCAKDDLLSEGRERERWKGRGGEEGKRKDDLHPTLF